MTFPSSITQRLQGRVGVGLKRGSLIEQAGEVAVETSAARSGDAVTVRSNVYQIVRHRTLPQAAGFLQPAHLVTYPNRFGPVPHRRHALLGAKTRGTAVSRE
jgi:hypothetical protein